MDLPVYKIVFRKAHYTPLVPRATQSSEDWDGDKEGNVLSDLLDAYIDRKFPILSSAE